MSAIVPPKFEMVTEAKYPEKSRSNRKVTRSSTKVVARSSKRKIPYEKTYTGRRPKYSERGAKLIGPNARPRI